MGRPIVCTPARHHRPMKMLLPLAEVKNWRSGCVTLSAPANSGAKP